MSKTDRDFECLISRHLDGALSEDEELQLNRTLIRDPDARRERDEYVRIDALASVALDRFLGAGVEFDVETLPQRVDSGPPRGIHRGWWLGTGAVAAALLAMVLAQTPLALRNPSQQVEGLGSVPVQVVPSLNGHDDSLMQNTATSAPKVRREHGREWLGVMGEDGRVYWIEVDRTRTLRQPRRDAIHRSALNEM